MSLRILHETDTKSARDLMGAGGMFVKYEMQREQTSSPQCRSDTFERIRGRRSVG